MFVATTFSGCHQIRPDNSVESDFKAAQIVPYLLLPAQWVQWSLVLHDGRAMVGSKKTPLQPCFAPCALQKSVKTLTIRSAHPMHRIKLCAAANITSRNIFFWRRWHFAKIKVCSAGVFDAWVDLQKYLATIDDSDMRRFRDSSDFLQTRLRDFRNIFINRHNFQILIQNVFIVYKISFPFQVIIGSGYQVPLLQYEKVLWLLHHHIVHKMIIWSLWYGYQKTTRMSFVYSWIVKQHNQLC